MMMIVPPEMILCSGCKCKCGESGTGCWGDMRYKSES